MSATSGPSSFAGSINTVTNRYLIVLPAGTYTLTVGFTPGLGGPSVTFNDPAPVTVSAGTVRDIVLPVVTTFAVSGALSGLNPAFIFNSLGFTSADASNAS